MSALQAGSISDKQITILYGLLNLLVISSTVMAGKTLFYTRFAVFQTVFTGYSNFLSHNG